MVVRSIVLSALLFASAMPAVAQQQRPQAAGAVSLADLLANGFEIKGAVMAGILVQNGPLAYICTTLERNQPVNWTCLPLHHRPDRHR